MCPEAFPYVLREDWDKLRALTVPRLEADIHALFYPSDLDVPLTGTRNPSFLVNLNSEEYAQAMTYVLSQPTFQMMDAVAYVDQARHWGQNATQLMMHISAWLNPDHVLPDHERAKGKGKGKCIEENATRGGDSKAMICLQLLPAMTKRWHNAGCKKLTEKALELERIIIDHFKRLKNDFMHPLVKPYLVCYLCA